MARTSAQKQISASTSCKVLKLNCTEDEYTRDLEELRKYKQSVSENNVTNIEAADLAKELNICTNSISKISKRIGVSVKKMHSNRTHRLTNFVSKEDAKKIIENFYSV